MTQDKRGNDSRRSKESDSAPTKRSEPATHTSVSNVDIPSKVVIRRLPPSLTAETFLKQISPIPNYDYFRFAPADLALGLYAFSQAYINFINPRDIWIFQEKFDGYVFLDEKGNEYPAIVEFAPYPRISKKKNKKPDPRKNTIEQDLDYLKFVETLKKVETEAIPPPEMLLEEIEAKEKLLKANHGCPKVITPLIEFLTKKKEEKRNAFMGAAVAFASNQHARDEKRRKELERRKQREELHRRQLEKEKEMRELNRRKQKEREERELKKKEEVIHAPIKLLKKERDEKERQPALGTEADGSREEREGSMEKGARPSLNDESRVKEQMRRDGNDRRYDDRKDVRDKLRRIEKPFVDRRREDDRRRDSDGYSQKESSYGARKKSESSSSSYGGDQSDRNRYKEKGKETDTTDKDTVAVDRGDKAQDRDNGGPYPGGYHGYRGQERDGKPQQQQRDRDYYRDGRKDDGRDYYRDGRREVKGDYKYDHGRPKESGKGPAVKDSRYPRQEAGHGGDHTGGGGGRRFHQEPRGGAPGSRSKPTSYDSRKDGDKSRSYDNRKDRERYPEKPSQSGGKTSTGKGASGWSDQGKKEATPPQIDEILARRGSCDSTGSSTSDVARTYKGKATNDGDAGEARKRDDAEWGGRSSADKDLCDRASNRQKIRYKDRPEKEIYNPAKRAVERQKEATTSSR